jgi:hypothetical protein
LTVIAAVVAPTTLLTGLLFYFGRIYANGTFGYFGVAFTVLDLTVSDYLTRSADALVAPLLATIGLTLAGLWLHQLLESSPAERRRAAVRIVVPSAGVIGGLLLALALVDLVVSPLFGAHPELRGVFFALGVVLLAYAVRTFRVVLAERAPPTAKRSATMAACEWGAVFLLVSIGLFWAVGSYAGVVGQARARQIAAELSKAPVVTVYSAKKLSLTERSVVETPCSKGSDYTFRYDGLTLVLQSGNQYLLLPVDWARDSGTAFLLPRGDGLRLEFSPPGQPVHSAC